MSEQFFLWFGSMVLQVLQYALFDGLKESVVDEFVVFIAESRCKVKPLFEFEIGEDIRTRFLLGVIDDLVGV
jgi:hypothetical protein